MNYLSLRYVDLLIYWKIIYQVNKFGVSPIEEILQSISLDYSLGGSMPIKSGLNIAQNQKSVIIDSNKIRLSEKGSKLILNTDKSEPTPENLRKVIYQILLSNKFPWVFFYNTNNRQFLASIPDNWIQILDNANLLDVESNIIKRWWESLLLKYNENNEKRLKEIGDIAENLTVQYESSRINIEAPESINRIKWISKLDDTVGYDILSVKGLHFEGATDSDLLIEVKGTERDSLTNFRFKLTRNEWEVAKNNKDDYYFYFWGGIKSSAEYKFGPYKLNANSIEKFVPLDQEVDGKWEICSILMDLTQLSRS